MRSPLPHTHTTVASRLQFIRYFNKCNGVNVAFYCRPPDENPSVWIQINYINAVIRQRRARHVGKSAGYLTTVH